jgi:hypothetical protein
MTVMTARRHAAATATVALLGAGLVGGVAGGAEGAGPTHVASAALPPPRFGHTLDVGLVSGTVIVTPPEQGQFTLGAQDRSIPIGSLIDTTRGRVDLRAAPGPTSGSARAAAQGSARVATPGRAHAAAPGSARAAARVEDAQFYDGAFRVRQSPANASTLVRLAGGRFAACSAPSRDGSEARLPHRVVRLLHASGSGRFQTDGRYAAATVRGTIWLTEDFCDGTLVRVTRGVVSVENLVTHATVTVRAGHSYFAAAG